MPVAVQPIQSLRARASETKRVKARPAASAARLSHGGQEECAPANAALEIAGCRHGGGASAGGGVGAGWGLAKAWLAPACDERRIVDVEHAGFARLSRAPSCEPVSDQKLERPVEADMGRHGGLQAAALQDWRAEAHEGRRARTRPALGAIDGNSGVGGKIAGEKCGLPDAVEGDAVDRFARAPARR